MCCFLSYASASTILALLLTRMLPLVSVLVADRLLCVAYLDTSSVTACLLRCSAIMGVVVLKRAGAISPPSPARLLVVMLLSLPLHIA